MTHLKTGDPNWALLTIASVQSWLAELLALFLGLKHYALTKHIPTATVIGCRPDNPYLVLLIKHLPTKHRGRWTLPGGRIDGDEGWLACAVREWFEEVGGLGATLGSILLFCCATDPRRDSRIKTLGDLENGQCHWLLRKVKTRGVYGYVDYFVTAQINGIPAPNPDTPEAEVCEYRDVREMRFFKNPDQGEIAAGHDVILWLYRRWRQTGQQPTFVEMSDFQSIRDAHFE
jgi:ADP-ribose pyrophosphatase YjhB (NUDIX family)